MKHTPAPWSIDSLRWPGRPHCYVIENESKSHANDGTAERQANARLIAAAPDLLEALRMAASFIENGESSGHTFFECREAWRNAFAKAEGAA